MSIFLTFVTGLSENRKSHLLDLPFHKIAMRKLVVLSSVFLILTGIALRYREALEILSGFSIVSALHIWAGMFFVVIFPMYAWDHIKTHRARLKKISLVSTSGLVQLLAGIGLIISGVILLLYESDQLTLPTTLHFQLTFALSAALLVHFIIKK